MKAKHFVTIVALAVLFANNVEAQLSTNPWATANDSDQIKKVYQKRHRRPKNNVVNYSGEEHVTIDRSAAYIQIEPEEKEDAGVLDKVKNMLNNKEEEPQLIPATSANKRALAEQKAAPTQSNESSGSSLIPDLGFNKQLAGIKKNLQLPNINVNGAIRKFEKAAGIDLKKIGKQLKK